MVFTLLFSFILLQRLVELFIAKRNEMWVLEQGGYEVGANHYRYMILLHSSFFAVLLLEVFVLQKTLSPIWMPLFGIFVLTQFLRIYCLLSLGKFWNTKIMILPGANVIRKGPYKWLRHPNYTIVCTEIFIVPLLFQAYGTAIIFTLLNAWMLSVRIPVEERALREATNYEDAFQ